MITLNDALNSYCYEHKTELPNIGHCSILGEMILREIKNQNKFIKIDKVETSQTFLVNNYPDEFVPIVNDTVEQYYKDRVLFFNQYKKRIGKKLKYFNYVINEEDVPYFEATLKKCEFKVSQNFILKGKAQYKIQFTKPEYLINLGRAFQVQKKLNEVHEKEVEKSSRKRLPAKKIPV